MPNPKISIVIPVYKTEAFIGQCLESVINQTFSDIEIIAVNDGSPDNAGKICDEYAQKDSRVKVYHQENQGGCVAMWKGANYATGEYVMYLDGDDWLDVDTCKIAYQAASENDADIVIWSFIKEFPDRTQKGQTIYNSDKVFKGEEMNILKRRVVGLLGDELKNPMATDAISSGWGKLYLRELIVNDPYCIIDEKGNHNFDSLINIRLFNHAKTAVYLVQFFNHYRQYNPNSATKTHKFTLLEKYLKMFENIKSFIDENKLGKDFQKALNNRIATSVVNNALNISNPKLAATSSQRISYLSNVINHDVYQSALKELQLSWLPIHWKLFFFLSKKKMATPLYLLTLVMRKVR